MCLLLGSKSEIESAYVQFPQMFYDGLKDDPYGNQLVILFEVRQIDLNLNLQISLLFVPPLFLFIFIYIYTYWSTTLLYFACLQST